MKTQEFSIASAILKEAEINENKSEKFLSVIYTLFQHDY